MATYEINGKEYEIIGKAAVKADNGDITGYVPIVDIPMMSDYEWQLDCLKSRLEHSEYYADTENVPQVIEQLEQWLLDYEEKHPDIKALRIAGHYKNGGAIAELLNAS